MPDWTGLYYDSRIEDKNLIAVWCYFCHRCGYIWLPRDFDIHDVDTLDREPPKSCARCKSKYYDRGHMNKSKDKRKLRSVETANAYYRRKYRASIKDNK